jgi:hypothetical protein
MIVIKEVIVAQIAVELSAKGVDVETRNRIQPILGQCAAQIEEELGKMDYEVVYFIIPAGQDARVALGLNRIRTVSGTQTNS